MCLIGDSIYDVEGANLVGIPCIAVTYGFGDVEEMRAAGAVAFVDNLTELPDVLKRM